MFLFKVVLFLVTGPIKLAFFLVLCLCTLQGIERLMDSIESGKAMQALNTKVDLAQYYQEISSGVDSLESIAETLFCLNQAESTCENTNHLQRLVPTDFL